jgi:peptidoglycan/xylan/chitin deacetylase (PgdA/CDA1 family)
MNVKAPADAAHATWPGLVSELDRWEEAGQVATLWWRDDDAAAMTPALARLLSLAGPTPLALAVIPEAAETSLADALRGRENVVVLQHGWSHTNHGGTGKKSEFPAERPAIEVEADLAKGHERLGDLFGEVAPVLAPPWNRFAPEFEMLLPRAGITVLSTMGSRPRGAAARIDVHVDLVAWKAGRGFVGSDAAVGGIIGELRRRRLGDSAGPTGILTHHLIMDDATAEFVAELSAVVAGHPTARWVDIREVVA